jgi:hypothetical protein
MTVFHHHGRKTPANGRRLMRLYTSANGALFARYLLKHPELCRFFSGDFKHAVRSLTGRKHTWVAEFGFTSLNMVLYTASGFVKYALMRKRPVPRLQSA